MHGTDDLICHFEHSAVFLDKIKDSKRIPLEGTGHELHEQDWDIMISGIAHHMKGK